jgi:hypothetical protein
MWKADEPLELLHIDLCGPITPETVGETNTLCLLLMIALDG